MKLLGKRIITLKMILWKDTASKRSKYSDDDNVEFIEYNNNIGWTLGTNNQQRRHLNDACDPLPIWRSSILFPQILIIRIIPQSMWTIITLQMMS